MNGKYKFCGLDPYLEYKVQEMPQSGWVEVISESGILKIPVSGGVQYNNTDFLNTRYGSICGYKYEDKDLSGTSPADTIVAGWGVTLKMWDGDSYEIVASTVTDGTGKYCFGGLDPYKKYAVYEELRDTWIEVIFKHEGLLFTSSGQGLAPERASSTLRWVASAERSGRTKTSARPSMVAI